jgi:hypothetical protein
VFTTGNGTKHQGKRRFIVKAAAITSTAAIGTALAIAMPTSASAATVHRSFAAGHFLSGTILGTNLDNVAALGGVTATNNGSQSTQTSRDPLKLSALNATLINQPNGIQLNLGKIIDAGVQNEYAQAKSDGTSMASSGAVNNDGGIGVGAVGAGAGNGNATVDLDSLLGGQFASVLSDVKLQAIAVAAQANAKDKTASGSYSLAGLKLNFTSPAIANLGDKVTAALDPVTGQLSDLNGANGALAKSVNNVTTNLNPVLNVLGANATVNAKVTANLQAALKPLLSGNYTTDGVTFNLQTGAVSVDLAKLLGGKLNNEPVGTQVLSDAVVEQILHGITSTVTSLGDQIEAKVKNALDNASVDVDVSLNTSTAQAPLVSKSCTKSSGSGSGSGSSSGSGGLGGLVGGVLGGTVGTVTSKVGDLLCKTTTKLLPDLKTSAAVHVHGTVDQIISGKASQATAAVKVLGIPVTLNVNHILSGLGSTLTNHLLSSDGALSKLNSSLESKLVDPAVTGLLGDGSGSPTSVTGALTNVLSVTLNNQNTSGGVFAETALRVSALPSTAGGVATVNLAAASVGPNVTTVTPVTPGDPGTPGNPPVGGNPSNPGTPSNPVTPASFSNLAFTGLGIGTLVAVILALLAAGAYLVREGYRRNSRRQIS